MTEHIRRLRAKIEVDPLNPTILRTARGVGYRFDPLARILTVTSPRPGPVYSPAAPRT